MGRGGGRGKGTGGRGGGGGGVPNDNDVDPDSLRRHPTPFRAFAYWARCIPVIQAAATTAHRAPVLTQATNRQQQHRASSNPATFTDDAVGERGGGGLPNRMAGKRALSAHFLAAVMILMRIWTFATSRRRIDKNWCGGSPK